MGRDDRARFGEPPGEPAVGAVHAPFPWCGRLAPGAKKKVPF